MRCGLPPNLPQTQWLRRHFAPDIMFSLCSIWKETMQTALAASMVIKERHCKVSRKGWIAQGSTAAIPDADLQRPLIRAC